jgi:hypothetical protein
MAQRLQVIPLGLLRTPPRQGRLRGEIATARFLLRSMRAKLFPPAQPKPLFPLWPPAPPQERLHWQAAVPGFIVGFASGIGTIILCLYFLV